MRNKTTFSFVLTALFLFSFGEASEETLGLSEAMEYALVNSPSLKAAKATIEMRVGEHIQSKAYPNPTFSYTVENIWGNRHWRGWDSAESHYELSQPIPLGSKREHRQRAACYEYSAAVAEFASLEQILLGRVKKAFLDVVAAEELYILAKEQKVVAEEMLKVVQAKVDAGKISPLGKNKALLENANSALLLNRAYVDLESAKETLSLLLGRPCLEFTQVAYPFYQIESLKCFDECKMCLQSHPELTKMRLMYSAANERIKQEKAEWVPDVIVTAGLKTERGERGAILGAAIPLPFFDSNSGNVVKAEAEACRLNSLATEIELKLISKLSIAYREAALSYQEVISLRDEVLELALESFNFAKQGYEEGKFEYLDLLESSRTLFEVQRRYIQAILQFLKNKTDIEYITI